MKYEPLRDIFPTPPVSVEAQLVLDKYADTLRQTFAFGTHVWNWHLASVAGKDTSTDAELPITLGMRHALEILDAIEILMRASAIEPCKSLARSLFETVTGIKYILEADSERRAMCFMVAHVHQQMGHYEISIENTKARQKFMASMERDEYLSGIEIPLSAKSKVARNKLKDLLGKSEYEEVNNEFLCKQKKNRNIRWYSLCKGPPNIRALAEEVGMGGLYEFYYRWFSGYVHGDDIVAGRLVSGNEPGEVALIQIRFPSRAHGIMSFSISIMGELYLNVLKRYSVEKLPEFLRWYDSHIRDVHLSNNPFQTD